MSFTTEEIHHICQLAYHRDATNMALAMALIQGRPWMEVWRTPLYWMYNRYLWLEQPQQAQQIAQYYLEHTPDLERLPQLLVKTPWVNPLGKPTLSDKVEPMVELLKIDLHQLAQQLFDYFPLGKYPINRFLFRYGTTEMRRQLLPYFWYRLSTGTQVLNLGGFQLAEFPMVILEYNGVQQLELWGNQFRELPDIWNQFAALQQLNIADNQLQSLPPSLRALPSLERLYLQNNAFDRQGLLAELRQMPQLQQLIAAGGGTEELRVLEQLVHAGLLQQAQPLQEVFLALQTQDTRDPMPMPSIGALLQALSSGVEPLPQLVRQQLLQHHTTSLHQLPKDASIAVLGLVTYATRLAIDALAPTWEVTSQLTPRTTHIVLGDQPELHLDFEQNSYVFLSEKQVQMLLKQT